MDKQDSIQVFIRVKPGELDDCLTFTDTQLKLDKHHFAFDKIFPPTSTQQDIFHSIGHRLLSNTIDGYNGCVFVYGQTGSGKTYTMLGNQNGLMQRSFNELFTRINSLNAEFILNCSYFELYNEQIIDLLDPKKDKKLNIRQDTKKGMFVENLSQQTIYSSPKLLDCLQTGMKNRHVGETLMNQQSSRSHSVFTISITCKIQTQGQTTLKTPKLHFVDLAGSERQKLTAATGDRLKEAGNINKSLSTLGMVINALASDKPKSHIPYRDSKLTTLLKDSLGGNSKTFIIATIASSISSFQETLSTLNFANRAKMVKVKPQINEESLWNNLDAYKQEIKRLKSQIYTLKNAKHQPKTITQTNLNHHFQQINHKITIISQQLSKNVCSPAFESILERLQNSKLPKLQTMVTEEQQDPEGNLFMEYLNSNYQLLSQVHQKVNQYLNIKNQLRMTAISGKLSVEHLKSPSKAQRTQYQQIIQRKDSFLNQLKQQLTQLIAQIQSKDIQILQLNQSLNSIQNTHKQQSQLTNLYQQSLHNRQKELLSLKAKIILCEQQKSRVIRQQHQSQQTIKQLRELYHYTEQKLQSQIYMRDKIQTQLKNILEKMNQLQKELQITNDKHSVQVQSLKQKIQDLQNNQTSLKQEIEVLQNTVQFQNKKSIQLLDKCKLLETNLQNSNLIISNSNLIIQNLNYNIVTEIQSNKKLMLEINHLKNMIQYLNTQTNNLKQQIQNNLLLKNQYYQQKQTLKYQLKDKQIYLQNIEANLVSQNNEIISNKMQFEIKIQILQKNINYHQQMQKEINKCLQQQMQKNQIFQKQIKSLKNINQNFIQQINKLKQQNLSKDQQIIDFKEKLDNCKNMIEENQSLKKSYQTLVKQNYKLKGFKEGKYQNNQELISKVQYYEQKFKLMSLEYKKAIQSVKKLKEKQLQQSKNIQALQENLKITRIRSHHFQENQIVSQLQQQNRQLKKKLSTIYQQPQQSKQIQNQKKFKSILSNFIQKCYPNQIDTEKMTLDDLILCYQKIDLDLKKKLQWVSQGIQRQQKLKAQNSFILKENIYIKQKLITLEKELQIINKHPRKLIKQNQNNLQ